MGIFVLLGGGGLGVYRLFFWWSEFKDRAIRRMKVLRPLIVAIRHYQLLPLMGVGGCRSLRERKLKSPRRGGLLRGGTV